MLLAEPNELPINMALWRPEIPEDADEETVERLFTEHQYPECPRCKTGHLRLQGWRTMGMDFLSGVTYEREVAVVCDTCEVLHVRAYDNNKDPAIQFIPVAKLSATT